jgi:hypothetical protein
MIYRKRCKGINNIKVVDQNFKAILGVMNGLVRVEEQIA